MATQTITRTPQSKKQPIRLLRVLQKNNLSFTQETTLKAKQFKFLELISLKYGNQVGTDLIYAYKISIKPILAPYSLVIGAMALWMRKKL